jgi:hypothetical protein
MLSRARTGVIGRCVATARLVIALQGLGRQTHAIPDGQNERQHVRVDPALLQQVTVAVKVDVLGEGLLRPSRSRVAVTGSKQLHQLPPLDVHGRAPFAGGPRVRRLPRT